MSIATFALKSAATAAFALGAAIGCGLYFSKVSLSGVPTIESFVSAGLVYWGLEKVRVRRGRDRLWHRP
ncbi:MAG TPA: hypothetical protein VGO37_00680 [Steroidobacteraceae bacterium]|jgi:hypothetical protein|nr:hypothetical protein [Steroidobacteraceae bacterium]